MLVIAALAGCSLSVDYTGTYYRCGDHGECPDGYLCKQDVCIPEEPDAPACATGIAAGAAHTCSIRTDGTVWCWGLNNHGQLGDNTIIDSATPVQVSGVTGAKTLVAGDNHTCAIADGGVWCWG